MEDFRDVWGSDLKLFTRNFQIARHRALGRGIRSRVKAHIYRQAPIIGASRIMSLQYCYTFDSD